MNQFERTAIFTMVEGIEAQLRGLKSLIAASGAGPSASTHKSTSTIGDIDGQTLTDEEEEKLARSLTASREKLIANMGNKAQAVFETGLADVIGGVAPPDTSGHQ